MYLKFKIGREHGETTVCLDAMIVLSGGNRYGHPDTWTPVSGEVEIKWINVMGDGSRERSIDFDSMSEEFKRQIYNKIDQHVGEL